MKVVNYILDAILCINHVPNKWNITQIVIIHKSAKKKQLEEMALKRPIIKLSKVLEKRSNLKSMTEEKLIPDNEIHLVLETPLYLKWDKKEINYLIF